MTGSCLHILSGQYHLLVDVQHVREVLETDGVIESHIHGCRLWRGASIAVLDLRNFLGEPDPPPPLAALVYEESETGKPVMLLFDRILGLLRCDGASFLGVPQSSGRITEYVDGITKEPATGQLLFHLKQGVLH